jgi:hypothetical protein
MSVRLSLNQKFKDVDMGIFIFSILFGISRFTFRDLLEIILFEILCFITF